jgi:16S rRNA (uracil1498-N3)-methyltransferase
MDCFYTRPDKITKDYLVVDGEEFAHLTHVMRRNVGDSIMVVDGAGTAYDVKIDEMGNRMARCAITARHRMLHEPSVTVTLGAAILKNSSNFDFLVEKTTELGVSAIVPLRTERSIPRHAKVGRLQKIALAAMKQSGRCVLPKVCELTDFTDFLRTQVAELNIIPHERTQSPTMKEILAGKSVKSVSLCIGPEGGFSGEEIEAAMKKGYMPVSLSARRLRTETAAIIATALALG